MDPPGGGVSDISWTVPDLRPRVHRVADVPGRCLTVSASASYVLYLICTRKIDPRPRGPAVALLRCAIRGRSRSL